jgi:hypothetical protein
MKMGSWRRAAMAAAMSLAVADVMEGFEQTDDGRLGIEELLCLVPLAAPDVNSSRLWMKWQRGP